MAIKRHTSFICHAALDCEKWCIYVIITGHKMTNVIVLFSLCQIYER